MQTKFGYSLAAWESAKEQMREVLIETARRRDLISYTDLAEQVSAIRVEAHDYAMNHLLGEISTDDHEHGHGMHSALVVYKDEQRPGPGFYTLARQLGQTVRDEDEYWLRELHSAWEDWGEVKLGGASF